MATGPQQPRIFANDVVDLKSCQVAEGRVDGANGAKGIGNQNANITRSLLNERILDGHQIFVKVRACLEKPANPALFALGDLHGHHVVEAIGGLTVRSAQGKPALLDAAESTGLCEFRQNALESIIQRVGHQVVDALPDQRVCIESQGLGEFVGDVPDFAGRLGHDMVLGGLYQKGG
jgi:hypothetical protein